MNSLSISIDVPQKILKGAGLLNTLFLPAWIYKVKITLNNSFKTAKLCSFNVALGNGIRYMDGLQMSGPDSNLCSVINVVTPNVSIGNNNVILFANNILLSPNSKNILTFDVCLCDKHTENSIENSGEKITHFSKINFNGHLLWDENVTSCSLISEACDYDILVSCEDKILSPGDSTKFYLECTTGQYDMVRSVYVRSVLDDGLKFIADSSNLEPRNVYTFDNRTILKWNIGTLQPSEVKRIGFKVSVSDDYNNDEPIKPFDILKNRVNSNCINNSTYKQCPCGNEWDIIVQ